MDRRHRGSVAFVAGLVLIVAACGGDPTSTPSQAQATFVVGPTSSPATASFAGVTETSAPTPTTPLAPALTPNPTPEPTPKPTAAPVTGWTKPHRIGDSAGCSTLTAGIDVASRYHIAAECNGSIHYYVSEADGPWAKTIFSHPPDRADLDPQIAFRGNVVYVGFSRIAPDPGCSGSRGADVGVYFRSRSQPDGAWSPPVRIGSPGDSLDTFRVDGDTIHATIRNAEASGDYYETLNGSAYHRYPISAAGSMRVGSDGRARIAYVGPSQGGLRYAAFTGSGFSSSPIGGSIHADVQYDSNPVLVLDANDKAHVVWTRRESATCGPGPGVGTYYATNASGTWTSRRITRDVGDTSLQVDYVTGQVHVLVGGGTGLLYFTKSSGGPWARTKLASARRAMSPALRLDAGTGILLAAYIDVSPSTGTGTIYALTTR